MITITDEKMCCGCGACEAVCPKKCIHMVTGTLGAVFPKVEKNICIQCGACEQVCPILNRKENIPYRQKAFSAVAKDEHIRFSGSSGGMVEVLSRSILAEGGIVYGAAFDENLQLRCTSAETAEELKLLCKSKYLQSDVSQKYPEIEAMLKQGRKVLFVSTPCQNAALKNYLKKDYPTLLTADFFCHGVPSQKFFDECLSYMDEKNHTETFFYEFRTKKKNGTTPHYFTKKFRKNGREISHTGYYFESPFYAAFQQYVTLRESCYSCKFSGRERVSDITIGDFHDIDKYMQGINRFDGVSTVIVNTDKGAQLLDRVREELSLYDMDIEQLIRDKTIFSGSTSCPVHRDSFVKCYEEKGISGLMKTYLNQKRYLKNRIYYDMPGPIRKLLKKLI